MVPEALRPSYCADQFAPLFSAEDRHFWFRSRNRCISNAVRSLPDFSSIHEVLEVGCGTGVVLAQLQRLFPNGTVTGMDLFEEGLNFARQRFQGRLIKGDIFQTSFTQQFDMIGAFDVIEHLDDDSGLLDRLWHLLRPGGHLVLTVPAHQTLWSYFDEAAGHRRRYAPRDLKLKMATAGFGPPFVTQFMAALFPAMWLKRRFVGEGANKLSKATASQQRTAAESDLRIHPVLNSIFELLLSPEPWLISHRIRIPLGTSLLCLAQRPR